MKKRIITSFKVFESSILPGGLGGLSPVFRKLVGEATPDEMTRQELEALLKKAKDEKDEAMEEEIEELISQIKVTELKPEDYKILVPPSTESTPPPPGVTPPPPPPGGNPPPPPPPKPGNEEIWPPKGCDPKNPPPPGEDPQGPEKPQGPEGPEGPEGGKKGDKPKDKPNPAIIGKKARITSGPNVGQIGTITGITPEGKVIIQPD